MRFFILLADGNREKKIVHGIVARSFALSHLIRVNTICNTKLSMHGKLVGSLQCVIVVASNDPAFRSFYRSVEVFSRFLTMAEVAQDVAEVITLGGCNSK